MTTSADTAAIERETFQDWLEDYRKGKPYWSTAREQICWDVWKARAAHSTAPTTGSATELVDSIAADRSADRQYIAGMKVGWSYCEAGNNRGFQQCIENRQKGIHESYVAAPPANAPAASVLSDADLSAIDMAACEWTDDWSERQELTPSKEACNAMFIRRVIALLAASMGGDKA